MTSRTGEAIPVLCNAQEAELLALLSEMTDEQRAAVQNLVRQMAGARP